jgi:hypothetical protein
MSQHVASKHSAMLKQYNTQRATTTTTIVTRQTFKKRKKLFTTSIANFFNSIMPYKNSDLGQELFLEDLIMNIIKGFRPLNSIENVWIKRLVFRQCGQITFYNKRQFNSEVILSMVGKTMECHVLPTFIDATIIITTFDLWMSQRGFGTFALVVNYINKKWEPCHVTMGNF